MRPMPAETVTEHRPGHLQDRHHQKDVNSNAQRIQANSVLCHRFFFFKTYGAIVTTAQNRLRTAGGRDDGQAEARNSRRKM